MLVTIDGLLRFTLILCFDIFICLPNFTTVIAEGSAGRKILQYTMGGAYSWLQKKIMAEEEDYHFPDNLEGFGYHFNKEGELRHMETNEAYEFHDREGDHHYNQKRYNALGDIITEKIYRIMETEHKLQRSFLPVDAEENDPKSFAFISGDLYTNQNKLMVLIHGSGAVRAGQWARRLIINENLDKGSQLPYIKWARENGYAVIVANTNLNVLDDFDSTVKRKKNNPKIRGNASPEEHVESLWREYVQRSQAKHIALVAHSYGGVCTLELAKNHIREFEERVFAIALTDSVHGLRQQEAAPEVIQFYKEHGKNWASAYDPLDAPLITSQDEVPTVSAGTDRHENTSYSCMTSLFKWVTERYEDKVDPSRKRASMGEPSAYTSPVSSDQQNLITRQQGEGEDEKEEPKQQPTNENPATDEPANQNIESSDKDTLLQGSDKKDETSVKLEDIKSEL